MSKEEDIREELADLCHNQWSGWMEFLFSLAIPYKPGEFQAYENAMIIPKWAVERWQRQMGTPYVELSGAEKESDQKETDKFLAIFKQIKGAL